MTEDTLQNVMIHSTASKRCMAGTAQTDDKTEDKTYDTIGV